ncbi:fructose-bisphosphatase class II family protein [Agromyces endophyticus]|uniref:fructose-bisphosphatase class II n=1 Tax=Agromyces sp. H17E-10 TaxID=2932244 RepID=UPI001FD4CD9D|nr:fructose-bisphosphatase class II [Agromyces sp. H17E-10]UOQ88569.1 fructose-bisphosphatase class II family protein [Agromyces sp. H17E-10]
MIVSQDVDALADALRHAVVAAAAACLPHVGSGDGHAVDAAAVAAMRAALADAPVDGRVVVGEGEKDEAPMLHLGERFGRARAGDPAIDIAVDPVDGTRLAASGRPGAMAVMAVAPRDGLFDLGPAHYLEKLVTWVPGFTAADASAGGILGSLPQLVERVAALRGVAPDAVRIAVQDRPRNRAYVDAVEAAGARVELFEHGDVERSLRALHGGPAPDAGGLDSVGLEPNGLDAVVGIGGAPEGVIVAAGARALGGSMLARFMPQSASERDRVLAHLGRNAGDLRDDGAGGAGAGAALEVVVDLDSLCPAPAGEVDLLVAAVTECEIGVSLPGVATREDGVSVHHWSASARAGGGVDLPAR